MLKYILFVCQGNIGRSQIAEALYNNANKKYYAISAGIDDVGHKYNYKPYPPIKKIMKNTYNINMNKQTVKHIKKNMIKKAEYLVLLTQAKECKNIISNDIYNHKSLIEIPLQDPQEKTTEQIECIIEKIKQIVEKLD